MNAIFKSFQGCLFVVLLVFIKETSAQSIATGDDHSFAICSDSTVIAWGKNQNGQLGNGTTTDSKTPKKVSFLSKIKAVAAGENHSVALKSDGTVWTWGDNVEGQLGNSTTKDSSIPSQIISLTNVIAIAAGGYHCLAIKGDGTVWAWGWNNKGQLGDGTNTKSTIPVQVSALTLTNIIAIAGGGEHSLALANNGQVLAWGRNGNGQLGDGTNINSNVPVLVGIINNNNIAIAAGGNHSFVMKSDSSVFAWGDNANGQLGDGTTTSTNSPVKINALTNVKSIRGGQSHSLALKSDGTILAWGMNSNGELGNGTNSNSNIPVIASSLTNVKMISAGQGFSIALRNDGSIRSWGNNSSGQLGNDTTTNSNIPVQVIGSCSIGAAVDKIVESMTVSVFPNPSYGKFTVAITDETKQFFIEIYTMLGKKITTMNIFNDPLLNQVDLSSFHKGIYFLKIYGNEKMHTEKILIK